MLHIPVFGVLAVLLMRIADNFGSVKWIINTLVFCICVGFGILNEIIQIFVPGRYGGLLDVGLNSIGSILGIAVYSIAQD